MNINQLINMFMRIFTRKIMNRGIDAGFDYASGRGKSREDMTPQEKAQARQAKQSARKAKQGAKLIRRIGRF